MISPRRSTACNRRRNARDHHDAQRHLGRRRPLTEIREELRFSIAEPIAHPERFEAMGLSISTGLALRPARCGKTLVAKATANEAMANFISIKGPELMNKYVGESERAVRTLFQRARSASPCVLFFDEMDSLAPRRGSNGDNTSAERVVNQLLTEMDGLEARNATFLIAATNRPDMIDPAMLRPGRLDKLLYAPLAGWRGPFSRRHWGRPSRPMLHRTHRPERRVRRIQRRRLGVARARGVRRGAQIHDDDAGRRMAAGT